MQKLLLLIALSEMLLCNLAFTQTFDDYISEVRGDTLVVKDYYDMGNEHNSLYYALLLDSIDVPAGRVYELKANGYYPLYNSPSVDHPTVIVGGNPAILVNNDNMNLKPPLICNSPGEYEVASAFILKENFTIKIASS